MMRTTVFPRTGLNVRPAFWGLDRDLKEVMESMESAWEGAGRSSDFTEFKETDQAYFVSIDLPGVNKSNLELQIEGEKILINATRKHAFAEGDSSTQKISRTLLIPKLIDREKIQAHCEDGVLYLALPKVEKLKPKKIEVSEGSKGAEWKNLLGEYKATEN